VLIPKIAEHYPAVANCGQYGTINVRLDELFDNAHADHWTSRTTWHPVAGLENTRCEVFGFIKIKFEAPNGQLFDAWIILPEGHFWTYDRKGVEIIADVCIPGIEYGHRCAFHLDHTPSIPRPADLGAQYAEQIRAHLAQCSSPHSH